MPEHDKDCKRMMMVDEFSIFDEEVEEVLHDQEVEAHCPKCRADTLHVVTHRYDDEIRKVRCNICEDNHAFRTPNGDDDTHDVATKKRPQRAKLSWEQVLSKGKKEAKPYNVNEIFFEMDIINHPIFGKGFVSELIGYDKIEVTFEKDRRVLIHNRQKRPIILPQYADSSTSSYPKEKQDDPLSVDVHEESDVEDLIALDEDFLLGGSTKLSPKAWAALHEDDEEESLAPSEEEDFALAGDGDSFDVGDEDENEDEGSGEDHESPKVKTNTVAKGMKKANGNKKPMNEKSSSAKNTKLSSTKSRASRKK